MRTWMKHSKSILLPSVLNKCGKSSWQVQTKVQMLLRKGLIS